jgi:hydrogenase maturation protease
MKPVLVIGLGNPLMGDDGIGFAVAERMAADSRLPESVEVICGGTDLLRYAGQMAGRERVVVIDAIQGDAEPGNVISLDEADSGLDTRQEHAHHLSAVQAIRLLQMTTPTRFLLLGVSICSAGMDARLSPALAIRMPAILDRALHELGRHLPGNSRPL